MSDLVMRVSEGVSRLNPKLYSPAHANKHVRAHTRTHTIAKAFKQSDDLERQHELHLSLAQVRHMRGCASAGLCSSSVCLVLQLSVCVCVCVCLCVLVCVFVCVSVFLSALVCVLVCILVCVFIPLITSFSPSPDSGGDACWKIQGT